MSKPNCLIIDEIDGAPAVGFIILSILQFSQPEIQASIEHLVKLARDQLPVRKKQRRLLRRPIICVCNDLYAPALRELRKISLTLHIPATESARLANRLGTVSF